jgi:hypothetical protein
MPGFRLLLFKSPSPKIAGRAPMPGFRLLLF